VRAAGRSFLAGLAVVLVIGAVVTDEPVVLLLAAGVLVLLVGATWRA
jgi:hypothetical protein